MKPDFSNKTDNHILLTGIYIFEYILHYLLKDGTKWEMSHKTSFTSRPHADVIKNHKYIDGENNIIFISSTSVCPGKKWRTTNLSKSAELLSYLLQKMKVSVDKFTGRVFRDTSQSVWGGRLYGVLSPIYQVFLLLSWNHKFTSGGTLPQCFVTGEVKPIRFLWWQIQGIRMTSPSQKETYLIFSRMEKEYIAFYFLLRR